MFASVAKMILVVFNVFVEFFCVAWADHFLNGHIGRVYFLLVLVAVVYVSKVRG